MYRVKITDDWIPLFHAVLDSLGWKDGDTLTLEVIGASLLVTKTDPDPEPFKEKKKK